MRILQFKTAIHYDKGKGAAKIVKIVDDQGREVSGFVPVTDYVESDWQSGKTQDVEVTNDPKYGWQFKWKKKSSYQAPQASQAPQDDRVLKGIIAIYKLLQKIDQRLETKETVKWDKETPVPSVEEWDNHDAYEPPASEETPF